MAAVLPLRRVRTLIHQTVTKVVARVSRQRSQETCVEDIHPPVHDAIEEKGKAESKDAVAQQLRVLGAADVS